MLELYNMTSEIKRVPKFRYNGKYILQPFESVDIEDSMAYFFKPYARVGVVVRCKKVAPAVEAERRDSDAVKVSSISESGLTQEQKVNSEPVKPVQEISAAQEQPTQIVNPAEQSVKVDVNKVYTEAELENMGLNELKEIAASMNLAEAADMKKKADVRALILNAYQKA